MYFRCMYCAIVKPHSSNALAFSPATSAVSLSQASESTDRATCRDSLNVADLSNDREVHRFEGKHIGNKQSVCIYCSLRAESDGTAWPFFTVRFKFSSAASQKIRPCIISSVVFSPQCTTLVGSGLNLFAGLLS